jgi:hypothetical protein
MIPTVAGKRNWTLLGGAIYAALPPFFSASFVTVGVCLLLALPAPGSAQGASDRSIPSKEFINLKVYGHLSAEVREALAELIEPESVSQLISKVSESATLLRDVCAQSSCPTLDEVLSTARAASASRTSTNQLIAPTIETVRSMSPLGATPGPPLAFEARERYAVIEGNDPIVRAARRASVDTVVAVPVESNIPLASEGVVIAPAGPANSSISIIEKDLEVAGSSERYFRVNRLHAATKTAALLEVVQRNRSTSTTEGTARPQETFSFIHFQSSGADCAAEPAHWPFNVARVVEVLQFNEKIRERLKLGPVRRSRILIVDTGLGKTLAQTAAFNSLLFADPAEIVTAPFAQHQFTGNPRCIDANANGYWRDVYGAGAGATIDDCLNPLFDHFSLVHPHPRKATSEQFYNPDHGSFVGALASGGPKFMESFPGVSNYVGLSFFRVTRRSDSDLLHVANEFSDITLSLNYAALIGADVINMSLKTGRDEPFDDFKNNKKPGTALLVASAGNNKEDLEMNAPDNRPASMDMGDQIIVVAAVQPNETLPWWPASAHSPSRVHVAAPGALITSFGIEGQHICDSGTSAAAPLVSFTAAMVRALTGAPRQTVRARVLAASEHLPDLTTLVEDGRRLNIEAALDVFVDRVELAAEKKVLRGWIEPAQTEPLVRVCQLPGGPLNTLKGKIDLALLWEWWKDQDGKAIIRHQLKRWEFERGVCEVPSEESFVFFNLVTRKPETIQWRDVKKLLPTPFRAVKRTILNSNSVGEAVSTP